MDKNKNTEQSSHDGTEINFGNQSDVGKKRKVNEDYYGYYKTVNGHLFLVCDGMGGHVGGEKASRIAVDAIRHYLTEKTGTDVPQLLSEGIKYANAAILDYARTHPELKGMGSTCVALLIKDGRYYVAHVGDSRAYICSGGILRRLTKDHSFVQGLIDIGALSEQDAEKHPRKNEITNALGLESMKPPTIAELSPTPGKDDIFLLCSDGLTGMIDDRTIYNVLVDSSSLQKKAEKLVELANEAGGIDNITVQIVSAEKSKAGVEDEKPLISKGKKTKFVMLIAGICIGLLSAGLFGNINKLKRIVSPSEAPSSNQGQRFSHNTQKNIEPKVDTSVTSVVEHGSGVLSIIRDLKVSADSKLSEAKKVNNDANNLKNEERAKNVLSRAKNIIKQAEDEIVNIDEKVEQLKKKYPDSKKLIVEDSIKDKLKATLNEAIKNAKEATEKANKVIKANTDKSKNILRQGTQEGNSSSKSKKTQNGRGRQKNVQTSENVSKYVTNTTPKNHDQPEHPDGDSKTSTGSKNEIHP
jgi:serine/threonine protein phosphatase PrpC